MRGRSHFVYSLLDAEGTPLYIGRSKDVFGRIESHHSECGMDKFKAAWFFRVRSVSLEGPFSLEEVKRVERERISEADPVGNFHYTSRANRDARTAEKGLFA